MKPASMPRRPAPLTIRREYRQDDTACMRAFEALFARLARLSHDTTIADGGRCEYCRLAIHNDQVEKL